jgi:hypothetical protein
MSDNGFDVTVVRRLFPEFSRRVNLVSGGSKRRVRDLDAALRSAADQAGLKNRFFSIVDKDSDQVLTGGETTSQFSWDVYHIENYLLDAAAIRRAASTLLGRDQFRAEEEVKSALRELAESLVNHIVLQLLQDELNSALITAMAIKGPPDTEDPAGDLLPSFQASIGRVRDIGDETTLESLRERSKVHEEGLRESLSSDNWMKEFPGRLILNRFSDRYLQGRIEAAMFRNAVLDKMTEMGQQPPSMKAVLDQIAAR